MGQEFEYDVFLSHSAKSEAVVRAVASRLWADGLLVWLDEWEVAKAQTAHQQIASELQPLAFSLFPPPPIKGSLAQFLYINWQPADGRRECEEGKQ